ncbi:MAG: hypothetical protein AAB288_01595, partial [Acidobacteriota bacterium]
MLKAGFVLSLLILVYSALGQTVAPGRPGNDAQWATAGKQAVGTSATLESKVWFTLAQGVMTEVYYPDVTVANVHLLQFVVVNPKTKKVETEQGDAFHQIREVALRPGLLVSLSHEIELERGAHHRRVAEGGSSVHLRFQHLARRRLDG